MQQEIERAKTTTHSAVSVTRPRMPCNRGKVFNNENGATLGGGGWVIEED